MTVPSSATSGPLAVTVAGTTVPSSSPFTVNSSQAPTITGFTPTIASAGTGVTVSGDNFDPTSSNNRLYFNTTLDALTATSASSLTTSVPAGATSGHLTVATPNGTAVSSADLFVPPSGYAPSAIAVTGRMAFGGSQVVSLTSAGSNGMILFDGTQGQRVSLNLSDCTILSVSVTIDNPDGTQLATTTFGTSGGFIDPQALLATGSYTIFVHPNGTATGSVTLSLYEVSPDVTGTITPGGAAVPLTVTTPGQNASLTFSGTQGQRVSLGVGSNTAGFSEVDVYNPDGTELASKPYSASTAFIDVQTLPTTGIYTIVVDPQGANTGSVTLTLYDVPPDDSSAITIGGPAVTVTSTTPGQNATLTFAGNQDETITLTISGNTAGYSLVRLYKPDGSQLTWKGYSGIRTLLGPTSLPATGSYTILVDPQDANTGSATLTLSDASALGPMPVVTAGHASRSPQQVLHPLRAIPALTSAAPRPVSASPPPAAEPTSGSNTSSDTGDWIPGPENYNGNWTSGLGPSQWQAQAPLQAGDGVTALAGQVLTITGQPLPGVTLSIGDTQVQTDDSGRFLLTTEAFGHQVLVIDGSSAGNPGQQYGRFDAGVTLVGGQTTVLPYTIWLPKLDTAHTVSFSSPTTGETVLTTPRIPGLEVHLPAGSTVKDAAGNVVTELGITAIPVDRPPFPLPANVQVPVYFTVQPGRTLILPDGAQIVYPNYSRAAPGSRMHFWHYDPVDEGWFIYGEGTVSPDGQQVIPDPDTRLYEFTGAMISGLGSPPSSFPKPGGGAADGDPVDLGTGLFVLRKTDLALPGLPALAITRTYRPGDNVRRAFGIGSTFDFGLYLYSTQNYQQADLILPDGGRIHYVRTSPGTGYADAIYEHTATPTIFYQSHLAWSGHDWELTLKDGTVYVFGDAAPLQAIRDRYGNQITLTRTNGTTGNITRLSSSSGRWITLSYDSSNRITQATDNTGRTVGYSYDASGRLATVTDPSGGVTTYSYDASNRMTSITDAKNITYLTNQYDANGRVSLQTQADGTTYQYSYTLDATGNVTQTDVTDPRGHVRRVVFNSDGYPISDTVAFGTAQAQAISYTREAGSNLVQSVTDALNRRTDYGYDAMGNITSVTRLAGTANAVTTTMTYTSDFNLLTSVTDPLNHTTTFGHDSRGNLTSITDANNHTTTIEYNGAGQPIAVTDALNHTSSFQYVHGDLVSVTDPLGRTSTRFVDAAGRVVSSRDPLGHVSHAAYDALNDRISLVDPLGNTTSFSYDPNGNLLSVTDANNHSTGYSYDSMDRVVTRTDPLGQTDTYSYDANGNLTQTTDRKQQVTTTDYDALDRPATVTFNDGSTISYSYDAGNRLTQLVDSLGGTIDERYDDLDRLTSETTPQGTVSYGYDAAGRRTSMTVTGQAAVSYSYDNGDRLTQITQGSATVGFSYDDANRRTTLTLPNGMQVAYGYDEANQLTSLRYTLDSTTLGDLSYAYDLAGRRVAMGGSYATTGLPQAMSGASYNADNQLTGWNGATLSYDADGNLTSDGTTTYSWDVRDQLSSLAGGVTASFSYDGFGRRSSTTVNGTTTSFLYDGSNLVQELRGSTPTATYLTGLAVDEVFSRSNSSGTVAYLTDGLGSTLGLADSSGTVQTSYTYDPFGNPTASGQPSSNPIQYTGREQDGTGLQYNRARYYSPSLQRWT